MLHMKTLLIKLDRIGTKAKLNPHRTQIVAPRSSNWVNPDFIRTTIISKAIYIGVYVINVYPGYTWVLYSSYIAVFSVVLLGIPCRLHDTKLLQSIIQALYWGLYESYLGITNKYYGHLPDFTQILFGLHNAKALQRIHALYRCLYGSYLTM